MSDESNDQRLDPLTTLEDPVIESDGLSSEATADGTRRVRATFSANVSDSECDEDVADGTRSVPATFPANELDSQINEAAFPIVGVGASAGGLEAFTQLLTTLPPDTGMAFVLVQHLAPSHPSALAEILSRATAMPVMEARDDMVVEQNHVYVIPPDRGMIIVRGALRLLPREGRGAHHPVDQFFRSLAEEQRHKAIGVVLSGTATDGTMGLEEIKAEGGITFAQDETAQYEGMPHSAIASGCVDLVLSPEAMVREIIRIGKHPYAAAQAETQSIDEKPKIDQIVQHLLRVMGVDFTGYKFNTLYRRVTRRMIFRKIDGLTDYLQFLKDNPAEVEALYQDILISVTSFFRDKESFEALKTQVFPGLLKERSRHDPVRVWTLGCSTGQEAYSLVMALTEVAEATGSHAPIQLFASDLNAAGIEKARAGIYSKDITQDVSPERLRRFFTEVDGGYRINKTIRESCVFSRHNVLADPPFSRIDLISCRNLLIYMEPVLQQRIMPTLHYALKPTGCLWLGGSETIGTYRNLFDAQDTRHKIYVKKSGTGAGQSRFSLQHTGIARTSSVPMTARSSDGADLHREADRVLLSRFVPPGVLVTADLDILQYRGDTSPYLAPAPGKASLSLLKMLREGLLVAVRAAVVRAASEQTSVREEGLRVKSSGGYLNVAIEVIPLTGHGEVKESGYLILFEDQHVDKRSTSGVEHEAAAAFLTADQSHSAAGNVRLEQELAATRDYLQSMIEQQEAANEELQSANEEIQSANEELQSANEELETSKEEIQSSNEELATVNDELQNRNQELGRANNDLVNLFGSIQMAVVLVGPDLHVRRFTRTAEKLFNLIPSDVGRPLTHIKLNIDIPNLEALLQDVLDSVTASDIDLQDQTGRWYSLRLRPYRTLDNKIDGVVVMVVDIDVLKLAHSYTESIVATVREPLLVLDVNLRVRTASASFYRTFLCTPEQTINQRFYELGDGQWNIRKLRQALEEILSRDGELSDFEVERDFERIGVKSVKLNARRLEQLAGHDPLILLAIEDVTEHKRQANELRALAADLSEADRRKNEFLATLAHELRNPLAPIRNALQILRLTAGDGESVRSTSAMMDRQLSHLVRLVDDLLDVSRISRGKIELRKERIDLSSIVNQAAETARSLYANSEQQLIIVLPPQPVYIDADPIRLGQVVGNLLNNASKFTDSRGRVELTLSTERREISAGSNDLDGQDPVEKRPGYSSSFAIIRIRDNGIGIAPDQISHIFELFVQIDTSLERSVSGLGIGLTLVKKLVELHGGTVEVRSKGIGHGSELIVTLPILDSSPKTLVPAPSDVKPPAIPVRRILIVDDNLDAAVTLATLLKLTGHETFTANDGLQAVEAAAKFRPELVLLDIGLPKLNGYEVARKIRSEPWGQAMVLVALTGWGQEEDRRKSTEAGFNAHLVKPVDYLALTKLLTELLPNAREG